MIGGEAISFPVLTLGQMAKLQRKWSTTRLDLTTKSLLSMGLRSDDLVARAVEISRKPESLADTLAGLGQIDRAMDTLSESKEGFDAAGVRIKPDELGILALAIWGYHTPSTDQDESKEPEPGKPQAGQGVAVLPGG